MTMRRAPRIWEQKLEKMIRSAGVAGLGAASSAVIGPPAVPGPDAGGSEPAPPPVVDEAPEVPRVPVAPSVFAAIGGFSILWTGLDANGVPFPAGCRVEVHVSTTSGFTPTSSTFRGYLAPGERMVLTDLVSGTTYYVRFVLIGPDGQVTEVSAQTSAVAGFVLSSNIGVGTIDAEMVSFDATAIGGIQQFVGTNAPTISNAGQPTQTPKDGSTWINTSNGSYYTLTSGAWVQRQWSTAAIAVGAINTLQIATGAITADSAIIANAAIKTAMIGDTQITNAKIQSLEATKLTAGTIDASQITIRTAASGPRVQFDVNGIKGYNSSGQETFTLNSFNGDATITGNFRTNFSGARVEMGSSFGSLSSIAMYNSSAFAGSIITDLNGGISMASASTIPTVIGNAVGGLQVNGPTNVASFTASGKITGQGAIEIAGANVDLPGAAANIGAVTYDAGFNGNRLRAKTSTQRVKYDIATVDGSLTDVDEQRQTDVVTVDPHDFLDVGVVEFSWVEEGEPTEWRELGFIADDVAAKFPIAASISPEGEPLAVRDTAMIAALLVLVREQRSMIEDLRARVGVLES